MTTLRTFVFCLSLFPQVLFADLVPKNIGGEGSVDAHSETAFSRPLKNASSKTRTSFAIGNSLFRQNWVEAPASVDVLDGLGPLFNAQSCSGCHSNDGRGTAPENNQWSTPSLLFRLSLPGKGPHGEPVPVPAYGDQLNPLALSQIPAEGNVFVTYKNIQGKYPDGTPFELTEPHYRFDKLGYGPLPDNFLFSPRLAPQIIGLGLLEAIPEEDLLKLADPGDLDHDGISGRPNRVWDVKNKKVAMGRLGWKANQPSVEQQDAGAFLGDMGVTSPLFNEQNCMAPQTACHKAPSGGNPEVSPTNLHHLTVYAQTLAVPLRKDIPPEIDESGFRAFQKVSCVKCHAGPFTTGSSHELKELRGQKIYPFTDLLLHDLGEALADHREDFLASGSEWRTPPLWGLGRIKEINHHTRLLHDGRARNFEEAILWHGGEAEGSKKQFMDLPKTERENLIRFLESL